VIARAFSLVNKLPKVDQSSFRSLIVPIPVYREVTCRTPGAGFTASDSSKQSASVMNTMHLQASFKVKNALANKSSGPAAVGKSNNNK